MPIPAIAVYVLPPTDYRSILSLQVPLNAILPRSVRSIPWTLTLRRSIYNPFSDQFVTELSDFTTPPPLYSQKSYLLNHIYREIVRHNYNYMV